MCTASSTSYNVFEVGQVQLLPQFGRICSKNIEINCRVRSFHTAHPRSVASAVSAFQIYPKYPSIAHPNKASYFGRLGSVFCRWAKANLLEPPPWWTFSLLQMPAVNLMPLQPGPGRGLEDQHFRDQDQTLRQQHRRRRCQGLACLVQFVSLRISVASSLSALNICRFS